MVTGHSGRPSTSGWPRGCAGTSGASRRCGAPAPARALSMSGFAAAAERAGGVTGSESHPPAPLRVASFPPALEANPYQRLLYEHLAAEGVELVDDADVNEGWLRMSWLLRHRSSLEVLHMHWPQGLWRVERGGPALQRALAWVKLATLAVRLPLARRLGYRLVWTVHQVKPPESRKRLDLAGARLLARNCDVLIAHDEDTAADARALLRRDKIAIVPHGNYRGVYPPGRPAAEVRRELGLSPSTFVFLCFGEVRAYKGLDRLLDAWRSASLPDAALVVAGRPVDAASSEAVETAARADARIKPLLGFVPDERVTELFGACDAAVIARNPGTSGSLILSLSLGRPVIAPRTRS